MAPITVSGVTFDPETERGDLRQAGLARRDSASSDYILVQTAAPLEAETRKRLADAGAEPLEYFPRNTYLCRYSAPDLTPLRELPFVVWSHVFLPGFKIAPRLRGLADDVAGLLALERGDLPARRGKHSVVVSFHRGLEAPPLASKVAEAGRGRAEVAATASTVRLSATAAKVRAIAALDEVRSIELDASAEPCANVACTILGVSEVHRAPPPSGLRGEGEIVAICDTGFDKGSTQDTHPAFSGRIAGIHALGGRPGDDPDGHGTHCAGCIAGDGNAGSEGPVTGAAPGASLLVQAVFKRSDDRFGGLPGDLRELFAQAHAGGARVHNNSWVKTRIGNRYNSDCHELDEFVWNHRDFLVVCGTGNEGVDLRPRNGIVDNGSIRPPAVAKNCLSVGASESLRPALQARWGDRRLFKRRFRKDPIHGDRVADNPGGMAAISGRGPAAGGRIKPDVVAPGTAILSTLSRRAEADTSWGRSADPAYFFSGGTSPATALASGCAAVARQFLRIETGRAPTAALIKALLIHGSRPLAGQYVPSETGGSPNPSEGWGCLDLPASVAPLPPTRLVLVDEDAPLVDTGAQAVFEFPIVQAGHRFTATLVWTDLPGESLVNDLDLIVRDSQGVERHGNAAPGSSDFDRVNNVERVVWEGFPAGQCSVIVRAFRIAFDPQSFALVVSGALDS